jgi:NPCBM/NEW2 domain-containing protein
MTTRFTTSRLVITVALAALILAGSVASSRAEEIWLFDNSRLYGLVQGITAQGEIVVLMPTGEEKKVKLEQIIAIRFLGRNPLLVQSGTQEFRFVNGGWLRGQILNNRGDLVHTRTAMAGTIDLNFSYMRGFVALPLAGFSGRKAEELVDSGLNAAKSRFLDTVLDQRGAVFPGVLRKLERTNLHIYHEDLVRMVPIKVLYVAGVRLAEAGRDRLAPWRGQVQMRLWGRDGSMVQGDLARIYLGKWNMKPTYDKKQLLKLDLDEISLVQIMGGRVQYLSQLTPTKVNEKTILAPPQPYRMDRSCQGDAISIAGKRYPWGIGVHADSELTFALNGRFKEFRSDVGIATRMGKRGSVIFTVIGDGKLLAKTLVVRGSSTKPHTLKVAVKGVKNLTLKVTNAGDLDLGDVANWGSARVLR